MFDTAGEDQQFFRDFAVSTIGLLVAYNAVITAFPVLRLPENTKVRDKKCSPTSLHCKFTVGRNVLVLKTQRLN